MTTYARIDHDTNIVQEIFEVPAMMADRPIDELFHPDVGFWVDVTGANPMPAYGWSYDGSTFTPPPDIDAGEARTAWTRKMGYGV